MATSCKRIKKSDLYKYVWLYHTKEGIERWRSQTGTTGKYYDTERQAAIQVDKYLIEKGKKPVNILKPLL